MCLWIWESHIWCTWCTKLSGKIEQGAGIFTFSICWTERNKANSSYLRARESKYFRSTSKNSDPIGNNYDLNSPIFKSSVKEDILVNCSELPLTPIHSSQAHTPWNPLKDPWTSRSRRLPHMSTTNLLLWTGSFPLLVIFHFNSTSLLRQLLLEPKLSRAAGTFGLPAFCTQHSVASWITSYGVGIWSNQELEAFFKRCIIIFFFLIVTLCRCWLWEINDCSWNNLGNDRWMAETYFVSFTS